MAGDRRPGWDAAIGIRPGEGGRLAGVAALFALLEAGRGLGEIGVETLVQGRFGPSGLPTVLPFLYMGLGRARAGGGAGLHGGAGPGGARDRCSWACSVLAAGAMVVGSGRAGRRIGRGAARAVAGRVGRRIAAHDRYWTRGRSDVRRPPGEAAVPAADRGRDRRGVRRARWRPARSAGLVGAENLVVLEAVALVVAVPLVAPTSCAASAAGAAGHGPRRVGRARTCARASTPSSARRCCGASRSPTSCWRSCMFSVQYPFNDQRRRPRSRPTPSGRRPWASCRRPSRPPRSSSRPSWPIGSTRGSGCRPGAVALAGRLPRRVRGLARPVLVPDRGGRPVRPAGHPARALERVVERVLQRRPGRSTGAGPRLQRRGPGPARARSCPASCCWPPAGSWPRTSLLARGGHGGRRRPSSPSASAAATGGACVAALRGGAGRARPRGWPGRRRACVRDPSVAPPWSAALRGARARGPRGRRDAARRGPSPCRSAARAACVDADARSRRPGPARRRCARWPGSAPCADAGG